MPSPALRLMALAFAVGSSVWLWRRLQHSSEEACIVAAFYPNLVINSESRRRALQAVETGTVRMDGTDTWAESLRYRVRDERFISDLAKCLGKHVEDTDDEADAIEFSGVTRVSVLEWDQSTRRTGIRGAAVSSSNPKVGSCVTDESGWCWISFSGLELSEGMGLRTDHPGVRPSARDFQARQANDGTSSVEIPAKSFVANGVHFLRDHPDQLSNEPNLMHEAERASP